MMIFIIRHTLLAALMVNFLPCVFAQDKDIDREDLYIQSKDRFDKKEQYRPLSLREAIDQGLRKNYGQQERQLQGTLLDIQWDDVRDGFWLPNVTLSLISAEHRVARLRDGGKSGSSFSKRPSGALALELGDYTLFNWGKDYLSYLNDKTTIMRSKDNLKEQKRDLKHQIIIKYFEVNFYQNFITFRREYLRHASFIYRLAREKVSIKKISHEEYYQARSLYLAAQSAYQEALNLKANADEALSLLVNETAGIRFILKDDLDYIKLKSSFDEILSFSEEKNTSVRDASAAVENAQRSHELTLKENLPLPKFTLNLGAYTHSFGRNQSQTNYQTAPGSSDLEVVATLNATWSITGPGGLFNGRKNQAAAINKYLAFNQLAEAKHQARSQANTYFANIKYFEDQMTVLDARNSNLEKTFDQILESYLNRKVNFWDFRHALEEKIQTEIFTAQVKYEHLKNKVLLAQNMGMDDYPGENFERLAKVRKEE